MLLVNTGQNEAEITGWWKLFKGECHYLIVKRRVENMDHSLICKEICVLFVSNVSLTG